MKQKNCLFFHTISNGIHNYGSLCQARNLIHINGVGNDSLFYGFPYFETSTMLPQCSSHDFLEGCVKTWLKIILENLVKAKWFSWDSIESMIEEFPFTGRDANSRHVKIFLSL